MEGQHYVTKDQLYEYLYPKALKVALRSTFFDDIEEETEQYKLLNPRSRLSYHHKHDHRNANEQHHYGKSTKNNKRNNNSWSWKCQVDDPINSIDDRDSQKWNYKIFTFLFIIQILRRLLYRPNITILIKKFHMYPKLLTDIMQSNIKPCEKCAYCVKQNEINQVAITALEINVTENVYSFKDLRYANLSSVLSPLRYLYYKQEQLNRLLSTLRCVCHRLSKILDNSNKVGIKRIKHFDGNLFIGNVTNFAYHQFGPHIFVNARGIFIWCYHEKAYIYPVEYLILIYNKLCDIISILECNRFFETECYTSQDTRFLIPFIETMARMAYTLQEKFFVYSKTLEAFNIGLTLKEVDGDVNKHFDDTLCASIYDEIGINPKLTSPYQILAQVTTPYRHELATLTKIMGHPFVDMKGGAIKLESNVNKDLPINTNLVSDLVRMSKKNVIKQFLRVLKTWPVLTSYDHLHPMLSESIKTNKDPDVLKHKHKYPSLEIYDNIEFAGQLELDYLDNFLPYLKDRTITQSSKVIKSNLVDTVNVNKNLFESNFISSYRNKKEYLKNTRLLFHYIMNSMVDLNHKKFVQQYQDYSKWELFLDITTIRIVPKEKELKELFRGFGCQSYMQRARCLVQESNSKRFLSKFSDEHAMTLGELESARKIQGMRMIHKMHKRHHIIYLNVDANKWNNFFRDEAIRPPSEHVLDKLFSCTLFQYTHKYYQKCWMYVPDGKKIYSWNGQQGGIEGLNQDTWVIHYINMIHVALYKLGIPYYLLCKGDDLRVAVAVPPYLLKTKTIDEIRVMLIKEIKDHCQGFGQDIKLDDSYASSTYFNFNKIASVGQIEMPQTLRKIQKVYGENNAMRRSLDLYIAGCFSNAHSAANVSMAPISCYWAACIWSSYYINTDQNFQDLKLEKKIALLLVPSCVGGLPIIYLHNLHTRGESDLLSSFIYMIQVTRCNHPNVAAEMSKFLFKTRFKKANDDMISGLLMDPYSLPVEKPPLPESVLYNQVRKHLPKICKNEVINYFLSDSMMKTDKSIIKYFASSESYDARIMSAIYAATPYQLGAEFVKRFETSSTIFDCLCSVVGIQTCIQILKRSVTAELRLLQWRAEVLKSPYNDANLSEYLPDNWNKLIYCPGEIADGLRKGLWGKPVHSVTIPPATHQMTLINPESHPLSVTDHDRTNHFSLRLYPSRITNTSNGYHPAFQTGPHLPFIGTRTNAALKESGDTFIKNNMFLSRISNLLDLHSWSGTYSDGYTNFHYTKLIENIITAYLPKYDFNFLRNFQRSVRGGTIQHHVRSRGFKEEIIPNILKNFFTRCTGSTDDHHHIRREARTHYNINFLLCYVSSVTMLYIRKCLQKTLETNDIEHWYLVTPQCNFCLMPIDCGSLCSSIVAPELPKFNYAQLHNYEEKILESLNNAIEKTEISSTTKLASLLKETIDFDGAVKSFLNNYIMMTQLRQTHILERYSMTTTDKDGIEILESLTGQTLTVSEGRTELKYIPLHYILHVSAITSCSHYIDRSLALNCISLDTFCSTENVNIFPLHMILNNLSIVGRYHEVIKKLQSTLPAGIINPNADPICLIRSFTKYFDKFIIANEILNIHVMLPITSSELEHCIITHLRSFIYQIFTKTIEHNSLSFYHPPFEKSMTNMNRGGLFTESQIFHTLCSLYLFSILLPQILDGANLINLLDPIAINVNDILSCRASSWTDAIVSFFTDQRSRSFMEGYLKQMFPNITDEDMPFTSEEMLMYWCDSEEMMQIIQMVFEDVQIKIMVYHKGSVHQCIRSLGEFQGNYFTETENLPVFVHGENVEAMPLVHSLCPGWGMEIILYNQIGYVPLSIDKNQPSIEICLQSLENSISHDNQIVCTDGLFEFILQLNANHNINKIYCSTLIVMNDADGHGTKILLNIIKPSLLAYHQHENLDYKNNLNLPFSNEDLEFYKIDYVHDQFINNTVDFLSPSCDVYHLTRQQTQCVCLLYLWTNLSTMDKLVKCIQQFNTRYSTTWSDNRIRQFCLFASIPLNVITENYLLMLNMTCESMKYTLTKSCNNVYYMNLLLYNLHMPPLSELAFDHNMISPQSVNVFHKNLHLLKKNKKTGYYSCRLNPLIRTKLHLSFPHPLYMTNINPPPIILRELSHINLDELTPASMSMSLLTTESMISAFITGIQGILDTTSRSSRSLLFNQAHVTQFVPNADALAILYDVSTRTNIYHMSRQCMWYQGALYGLKIFLKRFTIDDHIMEMQYKECIDMLPNTLFGRKSEEKYEKIIDDAGFILDLYTPFCDGALYTLRCVLHIKATV